MSDDNLISLHQHQIDKLEDETDEHYRSIVSLQVKVDCLGDKVDDIKEHLNKQDAILIRLDAAETRRQEVKNKGKAAIKWAIGAFGGVGTLVKIFWHHVAHWFKG